MSSLIELPQLMAIVCFVVSVFHQTDALAFRRADYDGACGVHAEDLGSRGLKPSHYNLNLDLDLNKPKFGGQVEIEVDFVGRTEQRVNEIWLNADESIDIKSAQYKIVPTGSQLTSLLKSSKIIDVLEACLNTKHQVLVLSLADDIHAESKGKLSISYEGRFGEFGLRKKSYEFHTEDSEPDVSFSLKSGHVRRLLPCFDDSPFESTFKLTVKRFPHLKALSNTDLDYDMVDRGDQSKVISFLPTAPIHLDELKLEMRA